MDPAGMRTVLHIPLILKYWNINMKSNHQSHGGGNHISRKCSGGKGAEKKIKIKNKHPSCRRQNWIPLRTTTRLLSQPLCQSPPLHLVGSNKTGEEGSLAGLESAKELKSEIPPEDMVEDEAPKTQKRMMEGCFVSLWANLSFHSCLPVSNSEGTVWYIDHWSLFQDRQMAHVGDGM